MKSNKQPYPVLSSIRDYLQRIQAIVGAFCILIILLAAGMFSVSSFREIGEHANYISEINSRLSQSLTDIENVTASNLETHIAKIGSILQEAQDDNLYDLAERKHKTQQIIDNGIRLLMLIMLVTTVFYLYTTFFFAIRLSQPLQKLTEAIQRLNSGDLNQTIPVFSNTEVGALTQPFNRLSSHISEYQKRQKIRIEKASHTLEATVASLPHPVFIVDTERKIDFMNPAGQNFIDATLSKDNRNLPDKLDTQLQQVQSSSEDLHPETLVSAVQFEIDRSERFFIPRIMKLHHGNDIVFGYSIVLEDVTNLYLIDQMKSGLISMITHELVTPITAINMACDLLRKNLHSGSTENNQELLIVLCDNVEALQDTLKNLTGLTQIDKHGIQLKRKPWNVADKLHQIAAKGKLSGAWDPKRVFISTTDNLPVLQLDPCIDHIFMNLLSNAFKYSPDDQPVSMRAYTPEHGTVRIEVTDHGPGIDPSYQSKIFEQFYRVPGTDAGGAGLGLFISRKIAQIHGAALHFSSESGKGCTFYVDFPADAQ